MAHITSPPTVKKYVVWGLGTSSKMIEPVDIMPQISCVIVPMEFNPLFLVHFGTRAIVIRLYEFL